MKQVGDMKLYDFEEILEETYGPVGTPERDEFENKVDDKEKLAELAKQQEKLAEKINNSMQISKFEIEELK